MRKYILIQLFLLFWAGWAQAQNFTGVWNASMVNDKSKVDPNIEYHLTQNGNTITGEIIHKKENMKATLTGIMANKEVTGTLKYDKNQWASLDQKFRIFIRANDNATMFMHESTKGARYYGGPMFKNQTLTNQQASKAQAATSLQKGALGVGSGTVVTQATGTPKVGVQMATIPKVKPRPMAGFYVVRGLDDPKGIKRDIYFEIKQYPNQEHKHTIEARVVGNDYGITGDPYKRFFVGDVEGNSVTFLINNLYEKGKKLVNAEGSIVGNDNSLYIKSPTVGYKVEKTNKGIAEREGVKLSPTVKVRVEYKFIYLAGSTYWDKSFLNYVLTDEASIALYGTGSIRAYKETSSNTTELKATNNAPARVFDIPKSRASSKHNLSYYDKIKNRSWGGINYHFFGFYSFAKDADMPKSGEGVTRPALFPVDRFLEFEVNRAALEGKTERVAINGQAHLSNALPLGDANFGNIHRKVYLHELRDQTKLTDDEKKFNRILEGQGHHNAGALVSPPYYFFAVKRDQQFKTPAVMIAFTVEIIE
ncbi:hypothetical protein J2X69_001301 [Algoriphagus sp. 4150]|nr:hypothetical protein [Algoriphagus sp. 4150]